MNSKILDLYSLIKVAGQKEKRRATGINFEAAKKSLSEDSGKEPEKGEIIEFLGGGAKSLGADKFITAENLLKIESMELDQEFKKILNQDEQFFVIAGWVLAEVGDRTDPQEQEMVKDFLLAGGINQPGKLLTSGWVQASDLSVPANLAIKFGGLYEAAMAQAIKDLNDSANSVGKRYLSNEVVHDFGDGWKVLYLPAAGEMEEFPGKPKSSHDRMMEGNKNGLCLGQNQGLYQDNTSGKIYSVRNETNEPEVTIRIYSNRLEEAKGKNNLSPSVDGAIHAKNWFESIDWLDYKRNYDFVHFPPTTIEEAETKFKDCPDKFISSGDIVHWYKNGLPEVDSLVERIITKAKMSGPKFKPEKYERYESIPLSDEDLPMYYWPLLKSGLGKKYKELMEPLVVQFCNYFNDTEAGYIFGGHPVLRHEDMTHESWKTYRKLPIMQKAVEKLCKSQPSRALQIGIPKIEEYKVSGESAIMDEIERDASDFLAAYNLVYPEWVGFAKQKLAKTSGMIYLRNYIGENSERDLIAAKSFAEKEPLKFLEVAPDRFLTVDFVHVACMGAAKLEPYKFIYKYYLESGIIIDESLMSHDFRATCLDLACASLVEINPYGYLKLYHQLQKEWGDIPKRYADYAAKNLALSNPYKFAEEYLCIGSEMNPYTEKYAELCAEILADKEPMHYITNLYRFDGYERFKKITDELLFDVLKHQGYCRTVYNGRHAKDLFNFAAQMFIDSQDPDKGPKIYLDKYSLNVRGQEVSDTATAYAKGKLARAQKEVDKQSGFLSILKKKVGFK